ncbi:MAG: flagellar biosynthesis protein FlhA [Treponemataceae bacterium]
MSDNSNFLGLRAEAKKAREAFFAKNKFFTQIAIAIGVVTIVFMLVVPLPTFLLDFFMALNLIINIIILLLVLFNEHPTSFSTFPSLLLLMTIFGLAINVSSTRLILTMGEKFDGAMINAFSTFVVGTSGVEGLVIGLVVFIIIMAVQVFVITKGSTRIAEVQARFTLDFIPTKQMSIENEYNSGAITFEEAQAKKEQVQKDADFYGAMDGASKFVSGNVKISIFITIVNIIGGLIIGVAFRNEDFGKALATYTRFTIGDGLLSQIPSLLISVAAGLIVTRSASTGYFGDDVAEQFSKDATVYFIAAAVLAIMAFLPGFPAIILLLLAVVVGFVGWYLSKTNVARGAKLASAGSQTTHKDGSVETKGQSPSDISPIVPLDPLSLELGYGLIPLVDKEKGAELLERITRIRRTSALELGLVAPRIRIIDNMRMQPDEYCFKIRGVEVARGRIRMDSYLAINSGDATEEIPGERTFEPAFDLPAIWISEGNRERAEMLGYAVVDPPSIIATHLTEIIKRNAADILDRQMVQGIIDALRKDAPAVVDDVLKVASLGEIQKILQRLLQEEVSIRNTIIIFETIADYRPITSDISILTERVRQALGRQICLQYADENKTIHALLLSSELTEKIIASRIDTINGPMVGWDQASQRAWIKSLTDSFIAVQKNGYMPLILTTEEARILVKNSTNREFPNLVVLAASEISSDVGVEALGEIS